MSNTNYAYSVARVRVLENRLLNNGMINRMLEADSAEEVLKGLTESDYGTMIAQTNGIHAYESILSEELKRVYKLITDISPEPEIIRLFSLKYDFHNLKVLLKARFLNQDSDEILFDVGQIPIKNLKYMVDEKDYRDLSDVIRAGIEEIEDVFSIGPQPQKIDLLLDKAMFINIVDRANEIGNIFLKQLFKIQIDLNNIRTLLRLKKMRENRALLIQTFLPGGSLGQDFFERYYGESAENLIEGLAVSEYSHVVEQGVREFLENGKFTKLEKLSDDYILNFIKERKHEPFGVEALVGYIIAKEYEVKNIRIIMVGKINRIPVDIIRERLRDTYA